VCSNRNQVREGFGNALMEKVINTEEFTWFGRERRDQKSISGDGGVGFLVRNSLGTFKVSKVSKDWDSIWIQVQIGVEVLFFAAVYLSPVDSTRVIDSASFIQELEEDICKFKKLGKVIVMGDLNSRIGQASSRVFLNDVSFTFERESEDKVRRLSREAKRRAKQILEMFNANGMIILNGIDGGGENTFVGPRGNSMIDFIVIDHRILIPDVEVGLEGLDTICKPGCLLLRATQTNQIGYVRNSMKVWDDFLGSMCDHRLVSCQLDFPGKSVEIEQKVQEFNDCEGLVVPNIIELTAQNLGRS
jgi:retrotransposon-encoded endonuclease